MKKSYLIILSFILILNYPAICQLNHEFCLSGMANLHMKNYSAAINDFSKVLEIDGQNHLVYIQRGEAYIHLDQLESAISDFNKANDLMPGTASFYLARTYAKMGRAGLAMQYLETHLASDYKLPEKKILLDKAFENIERTREWRNLWRKDWYTEEEILTSEVEYLIGSDEFSAGMELLDKLIREDPENNSLYSLRAMAHIGLREYKLALMDYDLALKVLPDDPDHLAGKAGVLIKLNRYDNALKAYNRAIYINPDRLDLYPERAVLLREMGELTKALENIRYYLQYYTIDEEALFLCGKLNSDIGKTFPALECFNKILEINRSNPRNFIARGEVYLNSGAYRFAIDDFSMALDLDPFNVLIYISRGKAFLASGKTESACYDFNKARNMGSREGTDLHYKYCR